MSKQFKHNSKKSKTFDKKKKNDKTFDNNIRKTLRHQNASEIDFNECCEQKEWLHEFHNKKQRKKPIPKTEKIFDTKKKSKK